MTLGDLKKALVKFDPDLDSSEVFMLTTEDGQRAYSLLSATGYITVQDTAYVALISHSEAEKEILKCGSPNTV